VSKLQERFAEDGGGIVVERALPVGVAPLRVVADASGDDEEDTRGRAPDRVRRS
jgi:hypothetical protein